MTIAVPRPPKTDTDRLERLLHPRNVAIAGYSSKPGRWGNRIIGSIDAAGYEGRTYLLRPRSEAPGLLATDSLSPGLEIDVVYVIVPARDAVEVIAEANAAGVAAAVVVSSGFAEVGEEGQRLQERLVEAAGEMWILGPNCLGMASVPARLNLSTGSFLERGAASRVPGPVAVVSQSGAVGMWLTCLIEERGIRWSYLFNTGNEATISAPWFAARLLERPEIETVVLYLESVRDPQAFQELGRTAQRLGKRVVVLRVGVSADGGRAAVSHTAAVATDDFLLRSLVPSRHVVFVRDENELVEAAHLQRVDILPISPRIGVVSVSGGAGAMIADQLAPIGVSVPPLAEATRARLLELQPRLASVANPVDLGGDFPVTAEAIIGLLRELAAADELDAVVFYYVHAEFHREVFAAVAREMANLPKPAWMVWAGAPSDDLRLIAPLGRVIPGIVALREMIETLPRRAAVTAELHPVAPADSLSSLDPGTTTEAMLVEPLRSMGVRYAQTAVASAEYEILGALDRVEAPWVLKIDSTAVPHRAKLGLVELGLTDGSAAAIVGSRLLTRARELFPAAGDIRLVVQHQLEAGRQLSVGAIHDPALGDFLVVGPGGGAAEQSDPRRAAVPVPITEEGLAAAFTAALRTVGTPISEPEFERVLQVAAGLTTVPGFAELDLNPVLVSESGELTAVDSLLITTGDRD